MKRRNARDGMVERLSYRPEEFALATGMRRSTLYEHLRTGAIPSVRIGRTRLIPATALDDLLRSAGRNDSGSTGKISEP